MSPAQRRLAIALLLIVPGFCSVSAQSLPPFIYAPNIAVGQYPIAVSGGDFNNDGRQDIVVANQQDRGLVILLAGAHGGYTVSKKIQLKYAPFDVTVADVNHDNRPDIIVTVSHGVSVLLGNGDGTFQPETFYNLDAEGSSIAVGDFNGDGAPDLAVSYGYGGTGGFAILLNNGDGTFGSPVNYANHIPLSDLRVGDFNNDGKLDLIAVGDSHTSVELVLGNGDGTFGSAEGIGPGLDNYPVSLAVGDVNGDGNLDYVAAGENWEGMGTVWVFLGNGDGTFQTAVSYFSGSWQSDSVVLADFNGDGRLDIAAGNVNVDIGILYGRGDGTFETRIGYMVPPPKSASGLAAVGNDLAVLSSELAIIAGDGKGNFQAARDYPLNNLLDRPLSFAFGDINGDGLTDMVVPDYSGAAIFLNKGRGEFWPPYYRGSANGGAVALGDFNNDGKLDLVLGEYNQIEVDLGDGSGNFGHPSIYPIGGEAGSFATGDFNGDGNLDIVAGDEFRRQLYVLIGNGDGTFHPPFALYTLPVPIYPSKVLVGDLNRDGNPDIFVAGDGCIVLLGNGDGTFQPPIPLRNLPGATYAVLADFNRDGILDVAVSSAGNGIDVAFGLGDGTFRHLDQYGTAGNTLVVGDFNGDGILDLATNDSGNDIELLYGNGDGSFQQPVSFQAVQVWGLGSADLNGDGLPDLVIAADFGADSGGEVGVAFNRSGKKF